MRGGEGWGGGKFGSGISLVFKPIIHNSQDIWRRVLLFDPLVAHSTHIKEVTETRLHKLNIDLTQAQTALKHPRISLKVKTFQLALSLLIQCQVSFRNLLFITPSGAGAVLKQPLSLINKFGRCSFSSRSSKHHKSQTVSARGLTSFLIEWSRHTMCKDSCHLSRVMCQLSHVP